MATRKKSQPEELMTYPDDYKTAALKLGQDIGITAAARELGIQTSQIYNWRTKQRVLEGRGLLLALVTRSSQRP